MDIIREIATLVKLGVPILITEEGWNHIIRTSQAEVNEEEYVIEV